MKYVVFQDETFAIIPETASHSMFRGMNPVEAGFWMFESYRNDIRFRVSCWGNSETLNAVYRGKEDALILERGLK